MKKTVKIVAAVAVLAVMCTALVACIPNDYEKAESNLKKEGYTILMSYAEGDVGFDTIVKTVVGSVVDGITAIVSAGKGLTDAITLVYFESSSKAKEHFDALKEQAEKDAEDEDVELIFKRSGKVIYFGTEDAVKAVK